MKPFRPFAVAALAASALAAHAVSIDVASQGSLHIDRPTGGPATMAVTGQTGGLAPLTQGGGYFYYEIGSGGEAGFSGPNGGFLAWIGRLDETFENGGTTYRGHWISNDDSSAAGAYSGYTGQGDVEFRTVLTHAETWTEDYAITMRLTGNFTPSPVPEPASIAALGFGAAALVRRRRRRSASDDRG